MPIVPYGNGRYEVQKRGHRYAIAETMEAARLIEHAEQLASAAAEAVLAYREQGPTDSDTMEAITHLEETVDAINGPDQPAAPVPGNQHTGPLASLADHGIKVLQVRDNWVDFTFMGRFGQMKVFAEPSSTYGIARGRISKLAYCTTATWDADKIALAYERGWAKRPADDTIAEKLLAMLKKALPEKESKALVI